jgi:hypothetical protein
MFVGSFEQLREGHHSPVYRLPERIDGTLCRAIRRGGLAWPAADRRPGVESACRGHGTLGLSHCAKFGEPLLDPRPL